MVLGRRNVGDSSTDCATARSLNWLLTAIAPAAAVDAFKNVRRFIDFRSFAGIMALSLMLLSAGLKRTTTRTCTDVVRGSRFGRDRVRISLAATRAWSEDICC